MIGAAASLDETPKRLTQFETVPVSLQTLLVGEGDLGDVYSLATASDLLCRHRDA
jgi:hypothetical protein